MWPFNKESILYTRLMMGLVKIYVFVFCFCCLFTGLTNGIEKNDLENETVIILHGLGRTQRSMAKIARAVKGQGYHVVNINYASRKDDLNTIIETRLKPIVEANIVAKKVHFVTHSMGGILVRKYLDLYPLKNIGNVVMLAPPNRGSELVDRLGKNFFYRWVLGPAFLELSTDSASVPNQLPLPNYSVGVIIGTKSLNPYFSAIIPGEDDGKVSTFSAILPGRPYIKLPVSHTWIMTNSEVIKNTLYFLKHSGFMI